MTRRLLAAAVVAAAFAVPAAAHATDSICEGPGALHACVTYERTRPGGIDPNSIKVVVVCEHPMPPQVCSLLSPRT